MQFIAGSHEPKNKVIISALFQLHHNVMLSFETIINNIISNTYIQIDSVPEKG